MTTRQGGTGLGLAIVKKIVEQHYGELEFSDNPAGLGMRVTLTLHPDRLRPLAGKGGEQTMGQNVSVQGRSDAHTSELQAPMRISYAVYSLKKKKITIRS